MKKRIFTSVIMFLALTAIVAQNAPKSLPCPGMPQFTDPRDGKTYNTVQIGDRCWMKDNLNVGNFVTSATGQSNNAVIEKFCYQNTEANCATYGGLYYWDEMMQYSATPGIQGICPNGWFIPTDNEWCTMATLIDATVNCNSIGLTGTNAGGLLKEAGTVHWNAPNTGASNMSDFTGLPGGYYTQTDGSFNNQGCTGIFHTSTSNGAGRWAWQLSSDEARVSRVSYIPGAYSLRCIRDANWTAQLSVTPANQDVTSPAGTTAFDVTSNTNWTVTENIPWLSVSASSGSNNSTLIVTYESNTSGIARVGEITITAGGDNPIVNVMVNQAPWVCNEPMVDSRDGRIYNTMQIGTQCWMQQNLNIGILIEGTENQINNGTIEKYCINNLESNCDVNGGLYQWDEIMQYSTTPGVQGICMTGWHLPTDEEWLSLENYVSSQPSNLCDNNTSKIAKSLASTNGWYDFPGIETCAVGYNQATNNATGFTGLPAGYRSTVSSFDQPGGYSTYWSSNQYDNATAWSRYLLWNHANFSRNFDNKAFGFSVRCLKD